MTWRRVAGALTPSAPRRGRTLNDRVSTVLNAASVPTHTGSVGAQVRERLACFFNDTATTEIYTSATNPVIVAAVRFDAFAHGWGSARFVPVAVSGELVRDTVACFDRELTG